jgi:outer membrane lipoprotein-sorting protein
MQMNLLRGLCIATCIAVSSLFWGCAEKLPTYEWTTQVEALAVIRERSQSIKTIQAACDITLTDPGGRSVTLDGALVSRIPGWLRMRAWKFNAAVFDVTMTPDGLWVMQRDSPEIANGVPSSLDASQIADAWGLLNGGFFSGEVIWAREKTRMDRERFISKSRRNGHTPGHESMQSQVERDTLLPLSYQGGGGAERNDVVRLGRYRMVNGIAFAHEIDLKAEVGHIVIRLRDVTLNEEPNPGAFRPPARAVKQP